MNSYSLGLFAVEGQGLRLGAAFEVVSLSVADLVMAAAEQALGALRGRAALHIGPVRRRHFVRTAAEPRLLASLGVRAAYRRNAPQVI